MSLDDRQHVEAVAIIRRLSEHLRATEAYDPTEALIAAAGWLRENHPSAEVYIAALSASPTKNAAGPPHGDPAA